MTHILFVTAEYPPMTGGGVGAYTSELGQALLALGVQVSVVTSQQSKVLSPESQVLRQAAQLPTPDAIAVYPLINRWGVTIWSEIAQLAGKIGADWVHVQYQTAAYAMNPAINFAPERWRGHWHKRWQGNRWQVGWTYHDLLPAYLFPKAGTRIRHWVTERPAQHSNLVIVSNEGDRLQLAKKGIDAIKIAIGSNISGKLYTAAQRAARRQQRKFNPHDLVIGYFGFLNRSKGGATVIRTLQQLAKERNNIHLLMIGEMAGTGDPTNRDYFAEIEALITALGLTRRVHWTGHQADDAVSADLAACDLLLLPYEDGASLRRGTLMAALANGCPLVTTFPQSPLPELSDGRDLLYVAPGDIAATTAAVLRIADDRQLAARLRSNARERSQLFSWGAIAQQHLACYENCN